jgi:hypothetical protein
VSGSYSLGSPGLYSFENPGDNRYEKREVKLMRFSETILGVVLVIAALPAMGEWQIVEDDFLYVGQNG